LSDITIIAPLGEPSKRVRLAKIISILHEEFDASISYWGWRREKYESLGQGMDEVKSVRAIVSGGGYRRATTKFYYLLYVVRVFFLVLYHAPNHVYALGLETALPVWLASRIRRKISYVFDDADRLLLVMKFPAIFERWLVKLEKKTSADSVKHIIPTKERYNYETIKQIVVENSPNKVQVSLAQRVNVSDRRLDDDRFVVYVNGWIDRTRGLKLLESAARILVQDRKDMSILFRVAVKTITDDAKDFLSLSNVEHLGSLSHVESLAQYSVSDVVVTFYDPSIVINRYALPNKWGDAIAMECPIICNSEVNTATNLFKTGAAFAVTFNNPEKLADLLQHLRANPRVVEKARQSIQRHKQSLLYFDVVVYDILRELVDTSSRVNT